MSPAPQGQRGLSAGCPIIGMDLVEQREKRLAGARKTDPEQTPHPVIGQALIEDFGRSEQNVGRMALQAGAGEHDLVVTDL